jgi:hypothetical protein
MASINTLTTWTDLSEAQQLREWRSFLNSLDVGDAGYHRWYKVLMPLWDRGDVPGEVLDVRYAARDAELQAEALWEAQHGFDGGWADRVLGPPPF